MCIIHLHCALTPSRSTFLCVCVQSNVVPLGRTVTVVLPVPVYSFYPRNDPHEESETKNDRAHLVMLEFQEYFDVTA